MKSNKQIRQAARGRAVQDAAENFYYWQVTVGEDTNFDQTVAEAAEQVGNLEFDATAYWENQMLTALDEFARVSDISYYEAETALMSIRWLNRHNCNWIR